MKSMYGFLVLCVPAGEAPAPDGANLSFVPALAESESALLEAMKSNTGLAVQGVQSLEVLRAQVRLVEEYAAKQGVTL